MKALHKLRTAAVAAALVGLASLGGTANATEGPQGGEPGPQHHVTCSWDESAPAPYSVGTDVVRGIVRVKCSDRLDKANTQAQVQVLDGGQWWDRGEEVISHNTQKVIQVNDDTTKLPGVYLYRTEGTHFGQHGNLWTLPTFYSRTQYLTG
ncbi:hypothetical protein OG749_02345 [Streptomyces nojiriensis]|uniref:hypothetical protein n=1 Tax=Streptomyces nojiriensis TaxID=66374 RepID=UPI002E198CF9